MKPEAEEADVVPLTVRALERALRRRILSWGPERERDLVARLRDDVDEALRARQ